MPKQSPQITQASRKNLRELGRKLRERRKKLGISAIATAEAAGMSRVTLYRIEKGEASVTMGAYLGVISALGLALELSDLTGQEHKRNSRTPVIPEMIRIADYKQLKRLAWQLRSTKEITPKEALDLYERNWRHINLNALDTREQRLLKMLLSAFGRKRLLV